MRKEVSSQNKNPVLNAGDFQAIEKVLDIEIENNTALRKLAKDRFEALRQKNPNKSEFKVDFESKPKLHTEIYANYELWGVIADKLKKSMVLFMKF